MKEITAVNTHDKVKVGDEDVSMDAQSLADLGGGEIGYIKEISKEEASEILGGVNVEGIVYASRFFVLHAANGRLIAISDSREAIRMNARENKLHPLSVH